MLAVSQSDNLLSIFRVGADWGERKAVINKFTGAAAITCQCWPRERQGKIFYGLANGEVKMGQLRGNKTSTVFSSDSYVVSMSACHDSSYFISGHYDCSVYLCSTESFVFKKIFVSKTIPYALGAGKNIAVAGNDGKVNFYDKKGNLLNRFDYKKDKACRDFTGASFNPNGESVVLGNYNRFYMFRLDSKRGEWVEQGTMAIKNYYNITAMTWKSDGSKFLTANLCGSVDMYDISLKKIIFNGKFELNYVSPSHVQIASLGSGKQSQFVS